MARAAVLLGLVPSLATRSLRDLGHSHLKALGASVSLSVSGGYTLPPGSAVRPSAEEGGVCTTRTPLLAEAWTGLFSKTIPSPAGIVKRRCPSVGCSGKDWKVDSAHCLSSVTVDM